MAAVGHATVVVKTTLKRSGWLVLGILGFAVGAVADFTGPNWLHLIAAALFFGAAVVVWRQ